MKYEKQKILSVCDANDCISYRITEFINYNSQYGRYDHDRKTGRVVCGSSWYLFADQLTVL